MRACVCGRRFRIRAREKRTEGGRGVAQESKRERERTYERSCKSRLKTQDGFLNGCRNADESQPEKEEQGDVERKERNGGTGPEGAVRGLMWIWPVDAESKRRRQPRGLEGGIF
ncbi:hypothetical protein OJAV_G00093650 [Oryzias javanicus]|uniref:Uncharacterized protein n=1 Tax=Oryzias javanicus TaxID=123683 RepID=A0A437D1J8_ORYJA|nr:hypothetical protein OJAV_G00093650 [Oryzias javanicus]